MTDTDQQVDLTLLDKEELLAHLGTVAAGMRDVTDRQQALWDLRLAIFQEARSRVPPVTLSALATAAGVSEVAVISKLRKSREAANRGAPSPNSG